MAYFREITEHYRIERAVSTRREGGVYRATDLGSGATVALKLLPLPASPESAQTFVRSMGLLQELRHASLPTLLDFGFTPDGHAFLVFEHLDGRGAEALQGGSPAQILPLLAEALDGLGSMAEAGLAHHNLCPGNLFVVPGPAPGRIKLLGLGTAALRSPGQRPEGEAASYAAPELGRGEAAGGPADLFALALLTCRLLGGRLESPPEDPRSPRVHLPLGVSFELEDDRGLQEILSRALTFEATDRPAFAELRQAFGRAFAGDGGPRPLPASRLVLSSEPVDAEWLPPGAGLPAPPAEDSGDPGDDTHPFFPEELSLAPPPPPLAPVVPLPTVALDSPAAPPAPAALQELPGSDAPRRSPPPSLAWTGSAAALLLVAAGGLYWWRSHAAPPLLSSPGPPRCGPLYQHCR